MVAPIHGQVYNVRMFPVSATQARRTFFTLLDAAEAGEVVVVERHGKQFRLVAEHEAAPLAPDLASPLVIIDPALLEGQWTWAEASDGALDLEVGPS